jgi:hypothetical protein
VARRQDLSEDDIKRGNCTRIDEPVFVVSLDDDVSVELEAAVQSLSIFPANDKEPVHDLD